MLEYEISGLHTQEYLGTYRDTPLHTSPLILRQGDAVRWTSSMWCTGDSCQILLLRVDSYFLLGSLQKNITGAAFSAVASPLPKLRCWISLPDSATFLTHNPRGRWWASQQDTVLSVSLIFFFFLLISLSLGFLWLKPPIPKQSWTVEHGCGWQRVLAMLVDFRPLKAKQVDFFFNKKKIFVAKMK